MKLFFSYLNYHRRYIFTFILFAGIFAVIFSLYDLQAEAVIYSCALCTFFGIVLFALGLIKYVKRHNMLNALKKNAVISIDNLPLPSETVEADYQELLRILRHENSVLSAKAETEKRDLMDYYTLWAHQIKTPIAAMSLLLQSDDDDKNAQLSIELMRIEQYVQMVLSYLQLDSEESDFVLHEYSLDSIVKQAVRKYAKLFILKKIPLNYKECGFSVMTDEKWLLFVLEQVLSNSLKYTQSGHISIYFMGRELVVEDTGIGIRSEDLPRVFEKGFTGYNGRENKKSTGIGLYLCKRICSKLSHHIRIESQKGKGTRVIIGFPYRERVTE